MLKSGQVVRYGNELYRVDMVNECRARIVPLSKRHVTLTNGREFDAERGGVNISPNSPLDLIDDIEAERDRIELAKTEAELAQLKAEQAREARVVKPAIIAVKPTRAASSGGWIVGNAAAFKSDSLASVVMAYIAANPGQTTKQIVEGVDRPEAVAACVSRFHQAGLIRRA